MKSVQPIRRKVGKLYEIVDPFKVDLVPIWTAKPREKLVTKAGKVVMYLGKVNRKEAQDHLRILHGKKVVYVLPYNLSKYPINHPG